MKKLFRYGLGVVLPPVGVFLTYGISPAFFINILLTLLAWLPGSIHAVWAIAKHYETLQLPSDSANA
ncbi:MAG: YqaE/Pmp3 family membrane protein [Phormidesmis sp.]